MKVVYIAGKYRSPTPWAVEQNIRAAEDVGAKVIAAGHMPLIPHANTRHMEGLADDAFFLAGTMELLRRCDAVLCVPNWRDSVGARAEVEEARRLGLPVFGVGIEFVHNGLRHGEPASTDAAIVDLCTWADCVDWLRPFIADVARRVKPFIGRPMCDATIAAATAEIDAAIVEHLHPPTRRMFVHGPHVP